MQSDTAASLFPLDTPDDSHGALQEQAHAALLTAIAMYRTMEMTFWLPQAEAALVQVSTYDNTPAE